MTRVEWKAKPAKMKVKGLVRDKHGNPKFNNYNKIAPKFWDMLSDEDKERVKKLRGELREQEEEVT